MLFKNVCNEVTFLLNMSARSQHSQWIMLDFNADQSSRPIPDLQLTPLNAVNRIIH